MADKTELLQAIDDAILDADSLEQFVNGSDSETVLTRLSAEYPTIKKMIANYQALFEQLIKENNIAGRFKTLADLQASPLVDGDYALVADDVDGNNGIYIKESGSWVKSKYDPVMQVINEFKTTVKSLLINGDFTNPQTTWYTRDVASKTITNSVISLNISSGDIEPLLGTPGIEFTAGNKYLVKARFKASKAVDVLIGASTNTLSEGYLSYHYPSASSEWLEVSDIFTAARSTTTRINIIIQNTEDLTVDFDYIEVINLDTLNAPSFSYTDKVKVLSLSTKSVDVDSYTEYSIDTKSILNTYIEKEQATKSFLSDTLYTGSSNAVGIVSLATGVLNTDSRYRYTDYLNVSNYEKIELSGFKEHFLAYAFYDKDKNVVANVNTIGSSAPAVKGYVLNGIIDVPDNAVYFARTMSAGAHREDYGSVKIVGYKSNSRIYDVLDDKGGLALSKEHKAEIVEHLLDVNLREGRFTDTGTVDLSEAGHYHSVIDVADYIGVNLTGHTHNDLGRYWLDKNGSVVRTIKSGGYSNIPNGYLSKAHGATYFAINLEAPTQDDTSGTIKGVRHLTTTDFAKKGDVGDATQGWGVESNAIKTSKNVEISNPFFPEIKPLKIIHYGKDQTYTVGGGYGERIEFDTEIFRFAWGIQICMNASKPALMNATGIEDFNRANSFNVKTLQAYNGLLAEWGVEGFSWHVSPPGADWGHRAWMNLKVGGHGPRGYALYPYQHGSTVQFFVPEWTERRDTTNSEGGAWTQSSTNPTRDDEYPTKTMIRQSAHFKSPEFYRATHGDTVDAGWDHYVRTRGSVSSPTTIQHGDCIHKEVFSVGTGAIRTGLPDTKEVAMMEVRYKEGDPNYEAEFIFKLKNKITGEWDEVAKH